MDFEKIISEVQRTFKKNKVEILGDDHLQIFVGDNMSKLSFYRPENPVKHIHEGLRFNNIVTPSLQDLLGMKLYTICVRTKSRDFYDIYRLLEGGYSLKEGISYASYLSRHSFKSKDMLGKLLSSNLYPINDEFLKLRPQGEVSSELFKNCFRRSIEIELNKGLQDSDDYRVLSKKFHVDSAVLPNDFEKHIELLGRYDGTIQLPDGTLGTVQRDEETGELRFQPSSSIETAIRKANLKENPVSVFIIDGKTYTLKDSLKCYMQMLPFGKGAWVIDDSGKELYISFSIARQQLVISQSFSEALRKKVRANKENPDNKVEQTQTQNKSRGKSKS